MKKLLIIFFLVGLGSAIAQPDLDDPTLPGDYRSGFAAANYTNIAQTPYENWINPGNEFCRVKYHANCDESEATAQEISGALATWDAMATCYRFRIRLHHQSQIRARHDTNDKIWVYYTTSIPSSRISELRNCQIVNVFEHIGNTYSQACATLNARQAGLCAHFYPSGNMGTIMDGWETDAE